MPLAHNIDVLKRHIFSHPFHDGACASSPHRRRGTNSMTFLTSAP